MGDRLPANCSCTDNAYQELAERAERLDEQILSLGQAGYTVRALSAAKQLIALSKDLRIPSFNRARTLYDAFQMACARGATLGQAGRFIAEAHELACAYGPDSKDAKKYEVFVSNPKSHRNYLICD